MVLGSLGLGGSFVWLITVSAQDSYTTSLLGPVVLDGLSAGLFFMPVTSTVLGGVAPAHAGAASGLLQTSQQLGGAIGFAVVASVYAAGAVPGEVLPGADTAFLTAAGFGLLAAAAALALVRRTRD